MSTSLAATLRSPTPWCPLLIRAVLIALAALGLFFNGLSVFAAAFVLVALLSDRLRGAGDPPVPDWPMLCVVGLLLLASVIGTLRLLPVLPDDATGQLLRNLANAGLIAIVPVLLTLRWQPSRPVLFAVRADIATVLLIAIGVACLIFALYWAGILPETIWLANDFNRVVMYMCIVGWVFAAAAGPAGRPQKAAWLIAALTVLAVMSESATAALSMIAGSLAFLGCFVFSRSWIRVQTAAVALVTILTPLVTWLMPIYWGSMDGLPFSWRERIAIWFEVTERWAERPLFGWGLKSSDVLDWTIGARFTDLAGRPITHAHNGTLQAMGDFGLIGFAAWLALLVVVGLRLGALHRNIRPYACAAYVSAYVTAVLAVDMWTDSFLAVLALTAALMRLLSLGSASAYDAVAALRGPRPVHAG